MRGAGTLDMPLAFFGVLTIVSCAYNLGYYCVIVKYSWRYPKPLLVNLDILALGFFFFEMV